CSERSSSKAVVACRLRTHRLPMVVTWARQAARDYPANLVNISVRNLPAQLFVGAHSTRNSIRRIASLAKPSAMRPAQSRSVHQSGCKAAWRSALQTIPRPDRPRAARQGKFARRIHPSAELDLSESRRARLGQVQLTG